MIYFLVNFFNFSFVVFFVKRRYQDAVEENTQLHADLDGIAAVSGRSVILSERELAAVKAASALVSIRIFLFVSFSKSFFFVLLDML